MLKKTYQVIEDIIATDDAPFIDVLVELFDHIFQKQSIRSHREALFLRAVLIYDRLDSPKNVQKHLFTSYVAEQSYVADFTQGLAVTFIKRFQNLTEFYSERKTPTMAARAVFNLIDGMNDGKFSLFRLFFMSGFFPYKSNIWIAVEDAVLDEQQSDKCEEVRNLLHRYFWALENDEALFLNYSMNLLEAHKDDPAVRFAIIAQLATYMQYRGMKDMQGMAMSAKGDSSGSTDDVSEPFTWNLSPKVLGNRQN